PLFRSLVLQAVVHALPALLSGVALQQLRHALAGRLLGLLQGGLGCLCRQRHKQQGQGGSNASACRAWRRRKRKRDSSPALSSLFNFHVNQRLAKVWKTGTVCAQGVCCRFWSRGERA